MSGTDPLAQIWVYADAQQARFSGAEVAAWADGHVEMLTATGVLRRDDNATTVVCDACHEGHVEEAVLIESPTGSAIRAYIHCPEAGRVSIPVDALKQWVVDFDGLARAAARGLDLAGKVEGNRAGTALVFGQDDHRRQVAGRLPRQRGHVDRCA